ncbi:hypothetical protein B0J14DRAFT_694419 [Halenospora varia]|nr:hypothetical protein B0J14DRAFT_694419 [Halenospora varia]
MSTCVKAGVGVGSVVIAFVITGQCFQKPELDGATVEKKYPEIGGEERFEMGADDELPGKVTSSSMKKERSPVELGT